MTATKTRQGVLATTVTAVAVALAGAALATPPSGILSGAIVARAAFLDPVDLKFRIDEGAQHVIHVRNARDTVMQQILIAPGGSTGWHTHPGPAVALIKAGALTLYSGDDPTCTGRTYSAGEAFIDSGQGHVHLARNLNLSENLEVWVTYFDVPPGSSVRLDSPDPGTCTF